MNGSLGVWMATVMNQVKGGIDWATTTEIVPSFIRQLLFNNKALISGLLNHPVIAWLVFSCIITFMMTLVNKVIKIVLLIILALVAWYFIRQNLNVIELL